MEGPPPAVGVRVVYMHVAACDLRSRSSGMQGVSAACVYIYVY